MKARSASYCVMSVLTLFTAMAQEKPKIREISLSEKEPVSHIRDIDWHANPKFTPPPAAIPEKAFLKNPLVDFAAAPSLWKARLSNCKGFLCLSKDQIARKITNLKLELTESGPDSTAELLPVKWSSWMKLL